MPGYKDGTAPLGPLSLEKRKVVVTGPIDTPHPSESPSPKLGQKERVAAKTLCSGQRRKGFRVTHHARSPCSPPPAYSYSWSERDRASIRAKGFTSTSSGPGPELGEQGIFGTMASNLESKVALKLLCSSWDVMLA